jgi:hypothetical protein
VVWLGVVFFFVLLVWSGVELVCLLVVVMTRMGEGKGSLGQRSFGDVVVNIASPLADRAAVMALMCQSWLDKGSVQPGRWPG